MNHYEFQRFMAYQKCVCEVLLMDFNELQVCEFVKTHGSLMRESFMKKIPYYKVALRINHEEYALHSVS